MLAVIFVALLASQAQSFAGKVTYRTFGKNVPDVLAEFSRANHLHLSATKEMGTDIVAISVKGVSAYDFMTRLADVTDAEWQNSGSEEVLVPSEHARAMRKSAELRETAARIDFDLKSQLTDAKRLPGIPPEDAIGMPSEDDSLIRLLLSIGPLTLAKIEPGTEVVYSTNPTSMQRVLTPEQWALIQPFIARISAPPPPPDPHSEPGPPLPPLFVHGPPVKALLKISAMGFFGTFPNCNLKLFDEQGRNAGGLQCQLRLFPGYHEDHVTFPIVSNEPALNLDETTADFLALETARQGPTAGRAELIQRNPKMRTAQARVLSPEKFDPLAIVGAPLVQAAEAKRLQLIALMPDSMFTEVSTLTTPEFQPSKFLHDQESGNVLRFLLDGKWLVGMPFQPTAARLDRIDRKELGAVLSLAQTQRGPDANLLLRLARDGYISYPPMPSPFTRWLMALDTSAKLSNAMNLWRPLSIFAALNPNEQAALLSGQKLQISSLPQDAQAQINSAVYYSGPIHYFGRGTVPDFAQGLVRSALPYAPPVTRLAQEPTEGVPNGISPYGYILAKTELSDGYLPADRLLNWQPNSFDAGLESLEDIADFLSQWDFHLEGEVSPEKPFPRLLIGRVRTVSLLIVPNETCYAGGLIRFNSVDWPQVPTAYTDLPRPFYTSLRKLEAIAILRRKAEAAAEKQMEQADPPPIWPAEKP